MKTNNVLCLLATATLFGLIYSQPVAAAGTDETSVEGRRVFTTEDFQRYAPRTALDMLQQVPGFVIREQIIERGLGQATGNVLINGQRMSGKSNEVITELGRIPVQNVTRIELADASSFDVSGLSGLVANVVVRAEAINGRYVWSPEFRPYNTDPRLSNFEVSAGGHTGRVEYSLGLDNRSGHGGADGPTRILNAQGEVIEVRDDQWKSRFNQPRLSGRFTVNGLENATANINLLYRQISERYVEGSLRTGPEMASRERQLHGDGDGYNYEVGGDYEFGWGPGRLKFIGLVRHFEFDYTDELMTQYTDTRPDSGMRFSSTREESEQIVRTEYRVSRDKGEWEFSLEGALNRLDRSGRLYQLEEGIFQPLPLDGATAVVEEQRVEAITGYSRPLSGRLTLQTQVGGEYSRLEQLGGDGLTRHFRRPKGSVALAWQVNEDTDITTRLQRRVGQLDFNDFVANVRISDDIQNAANPDLRPPQLWELESEISTPLGDMGTTTLRAFVHRIDDIVDIIPIGDTGESPGNLDHAWRYGFEWKNTLQFASLGWQGGRIDTRLIIQDSEVEDPLTGEKRPISGSLKNFASVSLRNDTPGSDWGWGVNASYEHVAETVRLTEQGRQTEGPVWASVYLEHRNVLGHTIRATIGNLLGARSVWDRTVYQGRRTDSIAFIEDRDRRIGPIFSFSIQGTF